jgi:hypothetical protein
MDFDNDMHRNVDCREICRNENNADENNAGREAGTGKNRLCYNPNMGQTCCSNNWACPSGSFCLVTGSCCPNVSSRHVFEVLELDTNCLIQGQSPQTCANQNGVTISSDFQVPTTAPIAGNSTGGSSSSSANKPSTSGQYVKQGTATSNYQFGVVGVGIVGVALGALAIL